MSSIYCEFGCDGECNGCNLYSDKASVVESINKDLCTNKKTASITHRF